MSTEVFQPQPDLPPPHETVGMLGWIRKNFFSSPLNITLTLVSIAAAAWFLVAIAQWGLVNATFVGDRAACQMPDPAGGGGTIDAPGACWAFIRANFTRIIFGLEYARASAELWRPIVFLALTCGLLGTLTVPRLRNPLVRIVKPYGLLALIIVLPIVSFLILDGKLLGLHHVQVTEWGGFLLTFILAVVGIFFAFPLGLLFALGRRSKLPIVRVLSVIYIEFWRGAPLITFLFISATILPLFLGEANLPRVVRAIIIITLFQSSYTAEAIRGGLAAIPRGQYEAADSLGLGWRSANLHIILPQAITISIPAIVGSFIELVKDTTLVAIIGLSDLFGLTREVSNSIDWLGYFLEGFIFVAVIFFILNYFLSQYSKRLEHHNERTGTI